VRRRPYFGSFSSNKSNDRSGLHFTKRSGDVVYTSRLELMQPGGVETLAVGNGISQRFEPPVASGRAPSSFAPNQEVHVLGESLEEIPTF
jgi:hypothetical protein